MRVRTFAPVVVAAALLLAACESEDTDPEARPSPSDSGSSAAPVEADGKPLKIGLVNQERGPLSFSDLSAGAEAAAEYVNTELGGLGGRPIDLVVCETDGSPEASSQCASRFVDADVPAVLAGFDFGIAPLYKTMEAEGVPVIGNTENDPSASTASNSFLFGPPTDSAGPAQVKFLRDLGVERATYVAANLPLANDFIDRVLEPTAEEEGLELDIVRFDPATPDISPTVAAALESQPEAVFGAFTEATCTQLVNSVRTFGYTGIVFAGSCQEFVEAVGAAAADGVYTYSNLAGLDTSDEQVAVYKEKMAQYQPEAPIGYLSEAGFSLVMNFVTVAQTAEEPLDAASVMDAFHEARDLPGFLTGPLTCDGKQYEGNTASCTLLYRFFTVKDGKLDEVSTMSGEQLAS